MGVGVKPQGMGMFSTFLKAQETSQTLVLAHAGIGDDGALEVARFVAGHTKLRRLDLTGNRISATGAAHLAGALRQNNALESLVLRHNVLGEGGESGIAALCKAVQENKFLRHLDLRHNDFSDSLAAAHLGELLRNNDVLTHLELSWNPLGPSGGQVLLDHIRQNSTLFDCQLTGCGIAAETLLAIADLLHRNRRACRAGLEAGPYRLAMEVAAEQVAAPTSPAGLGRMAKGGAAAAATARSLAAGGDGGATVGGELAPGLTSHGTPSGMVVSSARTQELREQLQAWRQRRRVQKPGEGSADIQELLDLLNQGQEQLDEEVKVACNLRTHLECLMRGYQDRVVRYQCDIEAAQDRLLDYQREHKELRAVQDRASDELKLQREAAELQQEGLQRDQRRFEAEEARSKNDLATITHEREACAARLRELTELLERQEAENSRLRARTEQIRHGVVVLQS